MNDSRVQFCVTALFTSTVDEAGLDSFKHGDNTCVDAISLLFALENSEPQHEPDYRDYMPRGPLDIIKTDQRRHELLQAAGFDIRPNRAAMAAGRYIASIPAVAIAAGPVRG